MAMKLNMEWVESVRSAETHVSAFEALVLEVQRLEGQVENLEHHNHELITTLDKVNSILQFVVQVAPGYDWNVDPLSLTLKTGEAFQALAEVLKR